MWRYPKLPFYASVGAIPESYLLSLSYEEQILWLCSQVQAIKEGTPNYNYELLENKPKINSVELLGNVSLNDLGIQEKLTAGEGISISGNVISATGEEGGITIHNLSDDLILTHGHRLPDAMESGFYNTTEYSIFIGDSIIGNQMFGQEEIVYIDVANNVISGSTRFLFYDGSSLDWLIQDNAVIDQTLTNSRSKIPTSEAVYEAIQNIEPSGTSVYSLENNLILTHGHRLPDTMESGFYNTSDYSIFIGSATIGNQMCGASEIVYIDVTNNVISCPTRFIYYDTSTLDWMIQDNAIIDQTLTNSRSKIPTSEAVYEALQGSVTPANVFYTIIEQNITLNFDGTSNYNFVDGTYYYLPDSYHITYIDYNNASQTIYTFGNSIFYYKENTTMSGTSKKLERSDINQDPVTVIEYSLNWDSDLNYWYIEENQPYYSYIHNYHSLEKSTTRDTISASGNNNDVPTINAVRDYVASNVSNYSTTEHVVGTWIDGKPLYERVASVTIDHLGNQGGYNFGDLVSENIGYATITGVFTTNNPSTSNLYNGYSQDSYNEIYIDNTQASENYGKIVAFSDKSYFLNATIYVVCRYTKTTD